jgi:hypothetical protein
VKTVLIAAVVIARAGQYDEAAAVLDSLGSEQAKHTAPVRVLLERGREARDRALDAQGPAQLQARASELAALDAWGRAYEVLAPHKEQIKRAPKFVQGFAELAVRAGEEAVAREVLVGHLTPAEIDQRIQEWSIKMGWH